MTTDPAARLAALDASPTVASIKEYAQAVAATLPPPTDQQVGVLMAYFPPREHNDGAAKKSA